MEAGMQSVDSLSRCALFHFIFSDKEPEKPLYQVLEKKDENIAPGTLLGTTHSRYYLPALDKTATKRVELPSGQKSDKVDVTIQPEDLEAMDDVLAARYEEPRKEWLQNQKADFSDIFAEVDRGIVIEGVIGSKIKSKLTIQRKGKETGSVDIGEEIYKFSYYRAKYINHFLEKMHRYIWSVDNTSNDGHCGFNALARHLGYSQIYGWRQVREELYQELETRLPFYSEILSEEAVAYLLTSIPCTESVTDKSHYMCVPDAAYLFVNRYMIPIVLLSKTMNYTFFPMCAPPAGHRETTLCAIGYVGKHFVIPRLIDHSPIPPPPKAWYRHKPAEAIPWITPYLDAIWAYKKMMKINKPRSHV